MHRAQTILTKFEKFEIHLLSLLGPISQSHQTESSSISISMEKLGIWQLDFDGGNVLFHVLCHFLLSKSGLVKCIFCTRAHIAVKLAVRGEMPLIWRLGSCVIVTW